ncbi:hypothetical protein GCM10027093_08790 [Paraburkholderia jirisanensis]
MTDTEKLEFLKSLERERVYFTAFVPDICGSRECRATAAQALRMATDHEGVYAELTGLSREDYATWVGQGGSVYCSARTQAGKPCKSTIVGGTLLEPSKWKQLNEAGGYCSVHGG